jgi:hypothetical protein
MTTTNFYRTKREAYNHKKSFEIVVNTFIEDIEGHKEYGYTRILNTRRAI